jgi:hypothetical protein
MPAWTADWIPPDAGCIGKVPFCNGEEPGQEESPLGPGRKEGGHKIPGGTRSGDAAVAPHDDTPSDGVPLGKEKEDLNGEA